MNGQQHMTDGPQYCYGCGVYALLRYLRAYCGIECARAHCRS